MVYFSIVSFTLINLIMTSAEECTYVLGKTRIIVLLHLIIIINEIIYLLNLIRIIINELESYLIE